MPSILERNGRWRALVRKAGQTKCATFATKKAAAEWARTVEGELDELRASGIMQPRGLTLEKLIDRYTEELYPVKPWGRSKTADLAALKAKLGNRVAARLTSRDIVEHFRDRQADGAGPVTISAQVGYLVGVLRVARTLWHLDVPLQAAIDARAALMHVGIVGRSKRRDRRVSSAEFDRLLEYFEKQKSTVPMAELLRFCMASAMRISEVCRLHWSDLNKTAKTVIVRDRKHPRDRIGNDQVVPLLNATGFDAFAIVDRQPRAGTRIFPHNPKTASKYVTEAVTSLKLGDLHLHDVRHEAISRLFEAGYRIEQVALVSGHRDWGMLRRYTHVRATDLHRTAPAEVAPK